MPKVIIKKRFEGWNAILADNHGCWEWGETVESALITLIASYPEKFGVSHEQMIYADPYTILMAAQAFEISFA